MLISSSHHNMRGRLAPSPTGHLHLGNAWAFLLAWLVVRSRNGTLVMRVEDIDPDRSKPEFVNAMLEDLLWLGIDWDEGPLPGHLPDMPLSTAPEASYPDKPGSTHGPYFQSLRQGHYQEFIQWLQRSNLCYPCYCSRKELKELASAPHGPQAEADGLGYPGICRDLSPEQRAQKERQATAQAKTQARAHDIRAALRLRLPPELNAPFSIADHVQGKQDFPATALGGDFAIQRSDGVVAYQLAVALDDIAMNITQVTRGRDILHCVPRQATIYHLLGRELPEYAHVPLLLDYEGERLAKRHQSLSLRALREFGLEADQITGGLSFWAGLVSSPQRIRPTELAETFGFQRIQPVDLRLPREPEKFLLSF